MADNKISKQDAEIIVRTLGIAFNNTTLYSPQHHVTKQALEDCYNIVIAAINQAGELTIAISDDNLMLNGELVDLSNPLMKLVVSTLTDLEIGSFAITGEMPKEKFMQLMDILNSKPDDLKAFGGFGEAVQHFELPSVKATRISVLQITEDEEVVSKDDGKIQIEDAANNIAEFLKQSADSAEDIEGLAEQLKTVASEDSDRLSDLILQSASDVPDAAADKPEEDDYTADVIASIQRVYDAIASDPSFKTQKGKKQLKKALAELEKSIVSRLKSGDQEFSDGDFARITESFETLRDEIEIDGLATEYMKKRSAIESNEKRLLRFIKSKGIDKIGDSDLKDKLSSGGLTVEEWQHLLFKSGVGASIPTDDASGVEMVGHLATLLHQMEASSHLVESTAEGEGVDKESIENIMGDVDKEVQKMVLRAEKKIQTLVEKVKEEDDDDATEAKSGETKKRGISKRKLLEQLAEVVQELCQPLSVINCSIEMILQGAIGEVSEPQVEMLKLADDSTRKVQVLIDHLLELSGVPKTLQPDKGIQDSIYNEPQGG
ncbi:hypothetical protein BVX97_03065 [bacterium E08(2017)]|nr:hypothetical protein BVX97_03065 [bacterium E08(2017)]